MNPKTLPTPVFRKFMIVIAAIICVYYLAYRAIYTFNLSTPYATFASVFLYVGELFLVINLLLYFLQVWEVNEPPAEEVLEGRTVDVLVPTYNEDPQLLRATLEACIRMDYPHKTFVLDDGRRPEVEALARDLGVIYISRPDNRHAKAGNLNNALEQTDSEFVVVLDADHVPEPQFITRLIGYFRDDKVAFVQTPHAFYNFDSFQARLDHKNRKYWEEGDLFYRVIQPGRNKWNAPIFAGSAAMFRRNALKEIGYIATETITEDLHTGLRLHARGWKSIAISERLIAGQAPPDITTFHSQRFRWGEGNLSIMAYDFPLTARGLSLTQRFCYFGSMIHWASGLFKLGIYLTPILMLFTGVPPVREFSWDLIVVTFTYLFFSLYAMKVVSNGYGSIIKSELFSMANFWTQAKATFRALFRRRRQRFVVTKKRGPQSKSIWPFVRPQTYLILLCVLAVVWGWSRLLLDLNPLRGFVRLMERIPLDAAHALGNIVNRTIDGTILNHPLTVGFGISDDYFKPVVPTIWCLILFWLAYKVTQRAFWPADRRFSTRHQVHLPVEYETAQGQSTRYGVTVDLNDSGMALVAYEELPLNAVLRFTIRGAGETVKLRGEVRSHIKVASATNADGYRYGIHFKDLTAPQIDTINRMCMHYAVPRMFDEYEKGNRNTLWNRFKLWQSRGMAQRRNATRNPFSLPFVVNTGSSEETTMYSTTEDISRVAAAAIFENDIPASSQVGYLLPTPLGDVRGTAAVIRSEPQVIAGRTYYRCVFEFKDFEGQGRTTVQSLVNPNENSPLTPVLKPDRKNFLPNMKVPIIVGLALAAILIVLQMGVVFPVVNTDDKFLREMIVRVTDGQQLTTEERKRYDEILKTSIQENNYPSNDRLVLLMTLGNKLGEKRDIEQVTQFIALRDRRNQQLSKALVDAYLNTQKYAEAEAEYNRLKEMQARGQLGSLDTADRQQLEEAGARVAFRQGHYAEAIDRFEKIFKNDKYTLSLKLRNEFAGVALQAGDAKKAADILTNPAFPLDIDGRKLLIDAYILQPNYDKAIEEVRNLAKEPNQADLAESLYANIYAAQKDYKAQSEVLQRLLDRQIANPDRSVIIRLSQAYASRGQFDNALNVIYLLLDKGEKTPEAIDAFVDAASRVSGIELGKPDFDLPKMQKIQRYALQLYTPAMEISSDNPSYAIYLARLGWVLQRVGESDKSSEIVQRALSLAPNNENIRRQLAFTLMQAGRPDQAARVLGGANSPEARKLLIGIYLEQKNFDEALKLARQEAAQNPTWENKKFVADILSWKGDFAEAIRIFEERLVENPQDQEAEGRIAEITLWAKYYNDAVAKFQPLLEPEQRFKKNAAIYGDGFIAAAASAKELTPAQVKIAQRLADLKLQTAINDPLILSRLAWVMVKSKDRDRADAIVKKLVTGKDIKDLKPEVRKEIAGVYAETGRFKEALALLENPQTDVERLARARLHAGAKEWAEALAWIKQVTDGKTADPPTMKEARILLADVTSYKGDHLQAIDMFTQLMADYPEDTTLPLRRAEVILWSKQYDRALQAFKSLWENNNSDPKIWMGFASAVAAVGGNNAQLNKKPLVAPEYAAIIRKIAERVITTPAAADALLYSRMALASHYIGDADKANLFMNRALELNSTDLLVRREMGNALSILRRYKEAIDMYSRMELTREDRRRLIDIATEGENMDLAVREARALVQLDPTSRIDKKLLADVLSWRGDFSESLALYEQLLRDRPKDSELMIQIATLKNWWRHYPEALIAYSDLFATMSDEARVYLGFIDAASSAPTLTPGQIKQALAIYDKHKDTINDAGHLARLAWVMIKSNNGDKADYLINRALAMKPTDPGIRKELAGAAAGRDRVKDAIELFASVEPDLNFNERITYAILLTSSGTKEHFEEAERQFQKLLAMDVKPKDAELRIRYADMLLWSAKYDRKRYDVAREEFEKLQKEYPKDLRFPIRIAQCLLWSGKYSESLPRFQELLDNAVITEPKMERDVWMGFSDSLAGSIGEVLRKAALEDEQPERYLADFFTEKLRKSIAKAYKMADGVKPQAPERVNEKYLSELRYYAQSLARLGLAIGVMGDRERGREVFQRAVNLNRTDREIWLNYAQALKLMREFTKAQAIYNALVEGRIPDMLP